MSDHYYSEKPSVKSERKTWEFTLRGKPFVFQSDRGVFSKNEVDFGSRLLIESFIFPDAEGDLLDVGCGYGPIGISLAAEFPDSLIEMVDINERAIQLAKDNAEKNNIRNVRIYQSNLLEQTAGKKYAAILSNPPIRAGKKVVHEIFEKSFHQLHPRGELWIVIQKKQGAPSALDKLNDLFGEAEVVNKDKGYFIIKAKKS
ncbi:methyltransferase [Bacillus lacus]|uniref:Methyltransferase n=1 Tax=Metabacillus lacus TaxID=1983721 RepID=A0A7X2IZK6_9BACI|nr:class I SAM-dependent methyltransferase [Metabacillus lacus]MRX72554.1 methyltransferase [Metabacillus lacus]